ncbi:holin [Crossiella sp. S99.1]|uniref:holin n=1 Tax=Crossiella sp. S99.1 TaxID=2936271 RepID=UPI0024945F70|nr:holin [Crossiella sp. S99.1]
MFTLAYWRDLTERMITTAAAAAVGALGGESFNLWTVDVSQVTGVALGAALVALLLGLAGRGVGDPSTAGFTNHRKTNT